MERVKKGEPMEQLNSREALLAAVRGLRDELDQVVVEVGETRLEQPSGVGAWTFKDLIAHLTGWRQASVARLEAGLRGEEPVFPWPARFDEEADLEEINRWIFETNHDKPLAEVLRESRETFARVERAIAALPEDDLLELDRFPWLAGYALGPAVVGGMLGHYHDEHEPDARAWLTRG